MPCPLHCKVVDRFVPPKSDLLIWSKAKLCRPKDHIKTEKCPRKKSFRPSFDCPKCQPNMTHLMNYEYNHIYENEHADFQKQFSCETPAKKKPKATSCGKKIAENPTKKRFTMKKFANAKPKVDTKGIDLRKNKTSSNQSNQFFVASPGCYPNFCCRCTRCTNAARCCF